MQVAANDTTFPVRRSSRTSPLKLIGVGWGLTSALVGLFVICYLASFVWPATGLARKLVRGEVDPDGHAVVMTLDVTEMGWRPTQGVRPGAPTRHLRQGAVMSEDAEAAPVTHGIISVTSDEITCSATYEVKRGLVTVRTDIGTRSGPLRDRAVREIAECLPTHGGGANINGQ